MDSINGIVLGIYEFQEGVKKGTYSDSKGRAQIIINGAVYTTYAVHIDRHLVSSAGSLISFKALLKEHGEENIQIKYIPKERRVPKRREYIAYRDEMNERKSKLK